MPTLARKQRAIQAAAVTVNNTETLADTSLSFTAEAGEVYAVRLVVPYNDVPGNGVDMALDMPAGASFSGLASRKSGNSAEWDGSEATLGPGNSAFVSVDGVLTVGTTPGAVTLQFAQATAAVGNTSISAGAALLVERVTA